MAEEKPWQVLGVDRNSSSAEVKQAFLRYFFYYSSFVLHVSSLRLNLICYREYELVGFEIHDWHSEQASKSLAS